MNPWSRLQWVDKKLANVDLQKKKLLEERTRLREIMFAELRGWPEYNVTRRESEVLVMLASNPFWTNKEIASKLFISERTVKFHVSSLLKKFDAQNRGHLMRITEGQRETVQ
jgi:DNA-binding CsgD family transcriptional regulator